MKSLFLASAFALSLVAQPVLAKKAAEPELQVIKLNVRDAGVMVIAAYVTEAKGKVAVCGVYFFTENDTAHLRDLAGKFLRKIYFLVDGKPLVIDTGRFKRYDSMEDIEEGAVGGCSASGRNVKDVKNPASFKMKLSPGYVFE